MGVGAPAEPAQRLVARIIDTLVVGLPVVAVAHAFGPEPGLPGRPSLPGQPAPADLPGPSGLPGAEVVVPVCVGAIFLLYESIQLALWGRTLGKRLAGIAVVAEDGRIGRIDRIGLWRALVRAAVYALPIAVRPVPVLGVIAGIFWVVNVALMFERSKRQALHDRLARTRVVEAWRDRADLPTA